MKNETLILQALKNILKSPGQKVSAEYFRNHFTKTSSISIGDLNKIIASLEQKGFLQTERMGRHTLLLSISKSGEEFLKSKLENERKRKERVNQIVIALGAIASLATILLFLPTAITFWEDRQEKSKPIEDYLVIQSATLVPLAPYGLIRQDVNLNNPTVKGASEEINMRCMNTKEDCQILLVTDSSDEIPKIKIQVTSNRDDQPLSITGLQLTLKEFRDLPTTPLNQIVNVACGGGGGYYPYVINDFQPSDTSSSKLPFIFLTDQQKNVPASELVGKTVIAEVVCDDASCNQFRYVTNQEVEGIELQMPFLQSMEPGWYEFQAEPTYKYSGDEYVSSDNIVFDVVRPITMRTWWNTCEEDVTSSFADSDMQTGSIVPNIEVQPMSNPPGMMIINSVAALDNGFYALDLQSGEFQRLNNNSQTLRKLIWSLPANPSAISSNGQRWAHEVEGSFKSFSADIGIFDLATKTITRITSDTNENVSPSISPSGNRVVFVTFAANGDTEELKTGQADLYIYDLSTQTQTRITNTPEIIEHEPTWINDNLLAYLVPQLEITGREKNVYQSSQGVILHNLVTGEDQTFSLLIEDGAELLYLPFRNALVISQVSADSQSTEGQESYLIDLNSQSVQTVRMPPAYFESGGTCKMIDATTDVFLCLDKLSTSVQIFKRIETGFVKYFEQTSGNEKGILVGKVTPDHLAIANLQTHIVYEFDQEGSVSREWTIDQADKLLHFYVGIFDPPEFVIITQEPSIPTVIQADTTVPSKTSAQSFQIQERIIDVSRPELNASFTISVPWFTGIGQADRFNGFIQKYVDDELAETLEFLKEPIGYSGGGMSIYYLVTSSNQWTAEETPFYFRGSSPPLTYEEASIKTGHDVISVLFENNSYFGGVHPNTSHATLNFDLAVGNKLELMDLFLPDSDYLTYISNYSILELLKIKDELFNDFQNDAGPDEKNFQDWAITRYGILILFEEYQVAPYMSGPKFVLIPYDYLKPIINPQGPIGAYAY